MPPSRWQQLVVVAAVAVVAVVVVVSLLFSQNDHVQRWGSNVLCRIQVNSILASIHWRQHPLYHRPTSLGQVGAALM